MNKFNFLLFKHFNFWDILFFFEDLKNLLKIVKLLLNKVFRFRDKFFNFFRDFIKYRQYLFFSVSKFICPLMHFSYCGICLKVRVIFECIKNNFTCLVFKWFILESFLRKDFIWIFLIHADYFFFGLINFFCYFLGKTVHLLFNHFQMRNLVLLF